MKRAALFLLTLAAAPAWAGWYGGARITVTGEITSGSTNTWTAPQTFLRPVEVSSGIHWPDGSFSSSAAAGSGGGSVNTGSTNTWTGQQTFNKPVTVLSSFTASGQVGAAGVTSSQLVDTSSGMRAPSYESTGSGNLYFDSPAETEFRNAGSTTVYLSSGGVALRDGTAPATPPTGLLRIYNEGGALKGKDSSGNVVTYGAGGTSISTATAPFGFYEVSAASAVAVTSTTYQRLTGTLADMQALGFTRSNMFWTYNLTQPFFISADAFFSYTGPVGAAEFLWTVDGTTVSRYMGTAGESHAIIHVATGQVVSLYTKFPSTGPATINNGYVRFAGVSAATWTRVYSAGGGGGGGGCGTDVSTSNVLAYYKFDEGTGTSAQDESGAHAGTLQGGAGWGTGTCGSDVSLTAASNQYVSLASPPIDSDDASFTVCIREKSSGTATYKLFSEGNTGSNNSFWYLSMNENVAGDMEFSLRDDAGTAGTVTKSGLSSNNGSFHSLCGVQTTKSKRDIYFDGVWQAADVTTVGTLTTNVASIGKFQRLAGSSNYTQGEIDGARLWSVALSTAEILSWHNSGR